MRIRAVNALRPGDTTATGQRLGRDASALPVLREAVRRRGFARQAPRSGAATGARHRPVARSFTAPASPAAARSSWPREAALELTATGARIRVASTEIGQGTRTMHAQIVADALGVAYDGSTIHEADTAAVPDSGPTVASRTCMIVGRLLRAVRRGACASVSAG